MIKQVLPSSADAQQLAELKVEAKSILDDFCDYSQVVVKKPWGYEYLIFQNDSVAVWILYLKHGAETSMHCHPNKKTSLVVLEGKVQCSTIDGTNDRSAGEGLLLAKGVFHQTKAVSEEGAFVMEIETPVNKRDLVRLRDRYGRKGQGYEDSGSHSVNTQNYNYITFNGPEIHYNRKKWFGQCTLTFKRVTDSKQLGELLKLEDHDVISLLEGKISDYAGRVITEVGDTITLGTIKSSKGLNVSSPTEILITKKADKMIKVSDYIVRFMKSQGAKEVFLVPGDANLHLIDSIGRDESLDYIVNPLERGAAMAAEAYSKLTSELGFLVISSGASGANTVASVANAWIDSTPIYVISGQARTDQESDGRVRQLGNKCLNITDIVKPVTKYAVKITNPTKVRYHLEKAAYLAKSGRPGPVWVDVPIDILGMAIDETELIPFYPEDTTSNKPSITTKVAEVLKLLSSSERPVLLAGSGIRLSRAETKFVELIDKLGIPVLTSRRGADLIPETHPLFFGRPGMYGQRRANFIIQNSDLLISLGSRLSIPLIGRNVNAFARGAKKVIVDVDSHELEKETVKPDVAIHESAEIFINELTKSIPKNTADFSKWIKRCYEWSEIFQPLAEGYQHSDLINPYLFIDVLASELKENDVIVADGGLPMSYAMQTFRFKAGQRLISSTGLELPGFAVTGSIGACVGNSKKTTICICEDGGLQGSIQELQTIIDNKLPVKIFVLKSKGRGLVRKLQKDFFGGRYVGTDSEIIFGSPALGEIAKLYGFSTSEIKSSKTLALQLREALVAPGPVVCEIHIDNSQELIPRMGFTVKEDGKWLAKPLENMYPFLDRTTLQKNMIIDLLEED